ncbi:MAG TPA: hypothetical protein PK095_13415, partial [Myxococcota bacterium]|nr:hypothetical protein [Myxococcota bacterium]
MTLARLLVPIVVTALFAAPTFAQETPKKTIELRAHGGATLTAPAYTELRKDDAVVVLEQLPDPAQKKTFRVLVLSVEPAPFEGAAAPWDKVKDNIVSATQKSGRVLTLDAGAPFTPELAGFAGRRFKGSLAATNGGRAVAIELVALVKDKRLVTVGLIAEQVGDPDRAIL